MLIHKIQVENFMARGRAELELPEAGVTVLTGANGAGKSRFIEAVAYAFWGETLRGADPWIEGEAGSVSVLTDVGDATRKCSARGAKQLLWNGQKADTNSRTQELIRAACAEFDFWRRTHVFSSGEAAHFSSATDGERKRIMEMLLGMEVFDAAQKACADEVGAVNAETHWLATELAKAEGRYNVACARLAALGEFPPFIPGTPPEFAETPALGEQLEQARAATVALEKEHRDLLQQAAERFSTPAKDREIGDKRLELRAATQKLELARAGRCSTCAQPWHGDSVEKLEETCGYLELQIQELSDYVARAKEQHDAKITALRVRAARVEAELSMTRAFGLDLEKQIIKEEHARRAAQEWAEREALRRSDWEQQAKDHAAKKQRAQAEVLTCRDELNDFRLALEEQRSKLFELQVAASILGVKGLRGHVLGRALDGVEAVANYWLQQIAPGRALTVRAEGDAGKITIGLQGFGGGKYKAASAGERRRVDAPLLLALAEVAGHGNHRGTLFLDEVFDALDRDGRALVCQALAELGQTQSVVVITHAEDLARAIPAVQRFEVSAGELRAIR